MEQISIYTLDTCIVLNYTPSVPKTNHSMIQNLSQKPSYPFLRSKEELYYIKAEYIIKIHTTLSKYSHTKQLQISIPNLCKKSNRRPHRHTLSKQAENKRPKNDDQHTCRLERAQSSSFFLRLSSSSFCHRWRRETDPNLFDPRLIDISLEDIFILTSPSPWLDLTMAKQRSVWRKLFYDDGTIPTSITPSGNLSLHVVAPSKLPTL